MLLLTLLIVLIAVAQAVNRTVSFDSRAFTIDGERKILISGSVHYLRSSVGEWKEIIRLAKENGIDVIETYTFWSSHEPVRGFYDFTDNLNVVGFLREVQAAGLKAIVRFGPYICGEFSYGGLPVWLRDIEGIKFRIDNKPWEREVNRWLEHIIGLLKEENMFYNQGGPVILGQIENEYGNFESGDGQEGIDYVVWNTKEAMSLDLGVPWIMCINEDAPQNIVSTCNGFYCHDWIQGHIATHPNQPLVFTELWTGWYQQWGTPKPTRPAEDIAYSTARWFAAGGSVINYYMLFGGTNFGRTSGGPFLITSYDYGTFINEFVVPKQPTYNHLKTMHHIIHKISPILLAHPPAKGEAVSGTTVLSYVYGNFSKPHSCVAFLVNDAMDDISVTFNNNIFNVPAWSVSVLESCSSVIYNTANVKIVFDSYFKEDSVEGEVNNLEWKSYIEPLIWDNKNTNKVLSTISPFDQISITQDFTDHISYSTIFNADEACDGEVVIEQIKDIIIQVIVNGKIIGETFVIGQTKASFNASLIKGENEIVLVSTMNGLENYGPRLETYVAGIGGRISFHSKDITNNDWVLRVGLQGEALELYSKQGSTQVEWKDHPSNDENIGLNPAAKWFKSSEFDAPSLTKPLAVVLDGLNKGSLWVNGKNLGRYWNVVGSHNIACDSCSYKGSYDPNKKCQIKCGEESQRFYHLPRDWLKARGNFIVVLEEQEGYPSGVKIVPHLGFD